MLKEKLHCLSHAFLTGHSSKSIKIKKNPSYRCAIRDPMVLKAQKCRRDAVC